MSISANYYQRVRGGEVVVRRDAANTGYSVSKSGVEIADLPDAFLNRNGGGITPAELKFRFSAAFDGVSPETLRTDEAEVNRRSGDVFCTLGLWGPR